ncbi:response regulator [Pedobacter jamesrossensis]|uniref:PleD family two-component system response regulator n=1 Tax=Pedobacter jamesrossensis TaxID=1908238 RepID=A0ABV8NH73_9SPHI
MEIRRRIKKENKKRILIVDSDLNILKLFSFILAADYNLTIKKSGIEALSWLTEGNDPSLIISGLRTPYFDGTSFIKNLKISGFYRNTPVILLSCTESLESIVRSLSFKVDSYLEKPFNPIVLKSEIEHLTA